MLYLLITLAMLPYMNEAFRKEPRLVTLTATNGIITSPGYPNSYDQNSGESWRLRVDGAESYIITFNVVDLDSGCYDYITLYDDNDYISPGKIICSNNKPSAPIVMSTSKVTVAFSVATDWTAGARGEGFSLTYQATGPGISQTTTITTPITSWPSTSTTPIETDSIPLVTTPITTIRTTVPSSGSFPPGTQDDSQCGVPAITPTITDFDYVDQWNALSKSLQLTSSRVIGGEAAVPHSWPWQVSLQGSHGSAYCGGTLVQSQWIVTAAHCAALVFIGTYGSDQAMLGAHDKRLNEDSVQLIDIVAKYTHPDYDNPDRSHDVALVKLKTPAILNDYVSLACEAHAGWTFPAGMKCVVTGWGVTKEGGNIGSTVLNQAALPLMSDQDCYTLYQEANLDTTQDMQCAGGQGKGACNGDSGGPLNCYVNNRWYHMGIVSFGEKNCDTDIASVYARVAELRGFIDTTISRYS